MDDANLICIITIANTNDRMPSSRAFFLCHTTQYVRVVRPGREGHLHGQALVVQESAA